MKLNCLVCRLTAGLIALLLLHASVDAQEGLGPFMPNEGGTITTA